MIYKPNYLFIIMSVLLLRQCTIQSNRHNQIKFITVIFGKIYRMNLITGQTNTQNIWILNFYKSSLRFIHILMSIDCMTIFSKAIKNGPIKNLRHLEIYLTIRILDKSVIWIHTNQSVINLPQMCTVTFR